MQFTRRGVDTQGRHSHILKYTKTASFSCLWSAGANAAVTISIKSGNTGGAFSISGSDLILATALDYEVTQFYDLLIEAVDGGTPTPLTSQVKLVDLGVHTLTEIVDGGTPTPLTSQVKLVDLGVQTLTEIVDGGTPTPLSSLVDLGVHTLTEIVYGGTLTPLSSQVKLVDLGVHSQRS